MRANHIALAGLVIVTVLVNPSWARETRHVLLAGNLNASAPIGEIPNAPSTFGELEQASQFYATVRVLDANGVSRALRMFFFHLQQGSQPVWQLRTYTDGAELQGGMSNHPTWLGDTAFVFDTNGYRALPLVAVDFTAVAYWSGSPAPTSITFRLPDLTQFDSQSEIASVIQDGCTANCAQNGGLDFDGDAKDDMAIWRPELGMWAIRKSSMGGQQFIWQQWGLPNDFPVAGDYDGDGAADLAVWRPGNGTWYVCLLRNGVDGCTGITVQQFGLPSDRPLAGDYDGDGIFDFAVWRPSTGIFYYIGSRDKSITVQQWGLPGDVPIGSATDN